MLREFDEGDLKDLYVLLKDEEVNTFLPCFPVKRRRPENFTRNALAWICRTPGPAAWYQLNPDGRQKVYRKYWNIYPVHFVETELIF